MAKGEIREILGDDGKVLYASSYAATASRHGSRHETGTEGEKNISAQQKAMLDGALKKLKWTFVMPSDKMLENEDKSNKLCQKTTDKLEECGGVMNKVTKMAEQTLPLMSKITSSAGESAKQSLRNNLKQLYSHIQKINEHTMGLSEPWKNSRAVKDDLCMAANATIACNDAIDICKALISAK